jgi:hypothetical protein
MSAAFPNDLVQLLLGFVVVAGSTLLVLSSLRAIVRRHKAEERFISAVTDSMRATLIQDTKVLERAKEGELTEKEKEDLREVIFDALSKLADQAEKDSIQRALKQPSPRGRENYERKILSESSQQVLLEVQIPDQATVAVGGALGQSGQAAQGVQDTAGQAAGQVQDTAGQAAGQAQETAGQATQQAQDAAGGAAQQAQDTAGQATQQAQGAAGGGGQEEPRATESARRKAEELGIDLSQIKGSGAGGLITIRDVVHEEQR